MLDSGHNFYAKLQRTGNYLLVKDDVGKPKPATRCLPSNDYSYGVKVNKDRENAGAVISSWAINEKKRGKGLDLNFKRLNVLSVGEKYVTAPQQRAFRKTVDFRRMSSVEPRNCEELSSVVYGMPLRPSTPIKAVLGNFYAQVASEEKHFAYSNRQKVVNRRAKAGSEERKVAIEKKDLFKMKKFLKVQAKTETRRAFSVSR